MITGFGNTGNTLVRSKLTTGIEKCTFTILDM